MKLRYALSTAIILPCLSSNVQADTVTDYATGRKGAYLKSTLQTHCKPSALCERGEVTTNIRQIYKSDGDKVMDIISGKALDLTAEDITSHGIIPKEWYAVNPEFMEASACDLFNIVTTGVYLTELRATYPIHDITESLQADDGWKFGTTTYYDDPNFTCLEPSEEHKGEIARAIFYMVTMYPATLWTEWGETLFLNNNYPTLNEFATKCYLQWHREHPVSAAELERNRNIEAIQGNRNPFVDYPILVEHLWGDRQEEAFGGGVDDGKTELPLQSSYRIDGPDINLYSPYVASDARWRVDGKEIYTTYVSPASLGAGQHELSYSSTNETGKLIITITP